MKRALSMIKLLLGLCVLFTYGCGLTQFQQPVITMESATTSLSTSVISFSSQPGASSIQELTHYAGIVAIGKVVGKGEIINTARDPNDPSKPDSRFYSINQIYQVEIEKVIKGDDLKNLTLLQNQGLLHLTPGKALSSTEINEEIRKNELKSYVPITLEQRYLFFLRVLDDTTYDLDNYKSSELFSGVMEPWRFVVTDTGMVIPETLLNGIKSTFPSNDLMTVLEEMNQPYVPGQINTPYPGSSSEDQQEPSAYP